MKTNNKEEYHDFSELISGSKQDISDYIDKRIALVKLKTYEKAANFSSRIMYGVVISAFVVILSILFVITAALYLGRLFNDYSLGFGIVFLAFIVVLILVALNKRRVRRFFVNKTLRTIKRIEEDED